MVFNPYFNGIRSSAPFERPKKQTNSSFNPLSRTGSDRVSEFVSTRLNNGLRHVRAERA